MKAFLSVLFYSVLFLFFTFNTLSAKEIRVCKTCALQTIQSGLDQTQKGDVLWIEEGLYQESNLIVEKQIHIKGKNFPVIDAQLKGNVLEIRASGTSVEGLKLVNSGVADTVEYAGIYLKNVESVLVFNNQLENNAYGIYLEYSRFCKIDSNKSIGNAIDEVLGGNGIHLWKSDNIEILNNNVSQHRDGLYFEFSEDLLVRNNSSQGSIRYGMHFMFSHKAHIENGRFSDNSTGAAIMYSREVEIRNTVFERSKGMSSYGILLKDITDSVLEDNTFTDNTIGIFGDSFARNKILRNKIERNGWAIQILGSCDQNVFSQNRFDKNIFDISTSSKSSENQFDNNYWEKYQGFDLNQDGIGDIPHSPVSFFSFWVAKYSILLILMESPIIQFLEVAEKLFPIMRPKTLIDSSPIVLKNT